jgi:hypothetical protein
MVVVLWWVGKGLACFSGISGCFWTMWPGEALSGTSAHILVLAM